MDRNGEIWVGTKNYGIARYIPETDDFKIYRGDIADDLEAFYIANGGFLRKADLAAQDGSAQHGAHRRGRAERVVGFAPVWAKGPRG